jgi:Metallo-peptidase family M12
MTEKHRRATRPILWITLVGVVVVLAVSLVCSSTAATDDNLKDLFISASNSDLTKAQQMALDKIKSRPTTADTRVVQVQPNLLAADQKGSINLNINPQADTKTLFTPLDVKKSDKTLTMVGKTDEATPSTTFVVNGGNVNGTIRYKDSLYTLEPIGGGMHVLIHIDPSKFPPDHPPEAYEKLNKKAPKTFDKAKDNRSDANLPYTLKVLVAYTPKVATDVTDVDGLIQSAIANENLSYTNSKIQVQAQLQYSYKVDYTESGSFQTDLDKFATKGDGVMDEVHDKRNQYKADVCVLLIDNQSSCGLADNILATDGTAFAVVNYSCAAANLSLAHEIGHLFGARHNVDADSTVMPFAYGHGYCYSGGGWRTVMSYECSSGHIRMPYWSSPTIMFGGVPTGTADKEDNARVLRETASTITSFR